GGAVVEVDASRRALLLPPSRGASRRVPLLSRHRWRALSAGEAAGLLGAVGRLAAQARAQALCLGEVRAEALLLGAGGLLLRSVAFAHPLRDAGCCGVPPAGSTARLLDLAPEASRARLRSAQEQSLAEAERDPAALSELLRYHLRGALTPVPVALPG
ncbi:hypothetical protein, partial [Leucobacter sp. M11]|uniref:hypothetical protein n=1 Tax=Leucobacter sp. M11 TaxID=2993565 RepID=UPI002D7FD659